MAEARPVDPRGMGVRPAYGPNALAAADQERDDRGVDSHPVGPDTKSERGWLDHAWIGSLEVAAASLVVALAGSLFRTATLLLLAGMSVAIRRQRPAIFGSGRGRISMSSLVGRVAGIVAAWTLVQIGLVMPALNRLFGSTQDLGQFESLQGDEGELLMFLVLTWTIAAVGEEFAYRGYVLTRASDALAKATWRTAGAIGISAVLFGLAHTEQGIVGVIVTSLDGLLFGILRVHYRTTWAPVLAHGLSNTLGLVAFYLVGPLYGLW